MASTIEFNVSGKILGRVASAIAYILQGKGELMHALNQPGETKVRVRGVSGLKVTGKKWTGKQYTWYTGYPGGLRQKTFKDAFTRSPSWVLRHAVAGMLPRNRLHGPRLKRLIIED